jgi:prophage antirepressor-like protein
MILERLFEEKPIRILVEGESVLLRAADVTPHLALDDTRQAVERLDDDEKVKKTNRVVLRNGGHAPPVTEWS